MITVNNVEFNDQLDGFVVTLSDDRIVQIQFEKETNRLHGMYGLHYAKIDKQNDYGYDLSDAEEKEFKEWMKSNKEIQEYAGSLDN